MKDGWSQANSSKFILKRSFIRNGSQEWRKILEGIIAQ